MDWTYNTLWTDQLPTNTYRSVDLKVGQTKAEDATNYPYVVLSGFKPKSHSLTNLVGIASAQYFELIEACANKSPAKSMPKYLGAHAARVRSQVLCTPFK